MTVLAVFNRFVVMISAAPRMEIQFLAASCRKQLAGVNLHETCRARPLPTLLARIVRSHEETSWGAVSKPQGYNWRRHLHARPRPVLNRQIELVSRRSGDEKQPWNRN